MSNTVAARTGPGRNGADLDTYVPVVHDLPVRHLVGGYTDDAVAGTLMASGAGMERPAGCGSETDFLVPCVAFSCKDHGGDAVEEGTPTLRAMGFTESHANAGGQLAVTCEHEDHLAVRRLTPRECERLQGVPDDHTDAPVPRYTHKNWCGWKRKVIPGCICKPTIKWVKAADGPRYKALGNSMAVPVMAWLGQRIERYEQTHELERTDTQVMDSHFQPCSDDCEALAPLDDTMGGNEHNNCPLTEAA